MNATGRWALLLAASWAIVPVARAQEGELPATFSSDRPGFANTTAIAARARLTTELGASVEIGDDPVLRLPHLSLRAGLFDWLEARVRGPNVVGLFGDVDGMPGADDPSFGLDDPIVGIKIGGRLAETVAMSSVLEVSIPLASDGFGSPEATWRADAQLDWRFWGPLTITPNGFATVLATLDAAGQTERYVEGGGSLKLTWQAIDVLAFFVQSYVIASERADLRVAVGGGVTWMVAPNVQVDAFFDAGVTDGDTIPPTAGAGTTILW